LDKTGAAIRAARVHCQVTAVSNPFFDRPILNSPYGYQARHWELDDVGQPTQTILETRRRAEFITPIPKPKKQKGAPKQFDLLFR
jgi:type III restriction enzyme